MAVSISIAITQNSQSIANNTSNVTVSVTAKWTGGSNNRVVNADGTPQANGWLKIDGTSYTFASIFNSGQTTTGSQTIFTKTVNVSHDSTGAKTLACSASYTTGVSSGTVTASASKALTTIPRKSTLAASNGTLGTAQTLTVTKQATSFTHTITYKCGSASGTICTKSSSTSISWTPPLSLAQQNTTGTSVTVTFTITTYNGSTSVGSNTKNITCSIPSSVKPTVSLAVSEATNYGVYLQTLSKVQIAVTASGSYGSTIKSYSTTFDGKTYTTSSVTSGFIVGSGTMTISTTVTDSRGRTATASTTITVVAYHAPQITEMSVYRSNSDGSANPSGGYLRVEFTDIISESVDYHYLYYTVKYKKVSETEYTTLSSGTYIFAADTASSYDVVLTIEDGYSSISKAQVGPSARKLWSIFKKGLGLAFGKVAELEGVFDVDFVIRARKGIIVDAEWIDLTIADNFALYGGAVANQPKYKVTGNVVTVMGVLTPETEFTSSTTGVVIARGIPEDLCPSVNLQFVCQGSSMNRWACSITTAGAVTISRYGTTAATTVAAGAWLPFCVTYQI